MSPSNFDIPSQMRAWEFTRVGLPPNTLKLSRVPVPSLPTQTSVLVRVSHAALHPGTSIMAQIVPFLFRKSPAIAETDFSGIVVKVGDQVDTEDSGSGRSFPVGTPVFGTINVPAHLGTGAGALAEYVAVESSNIARKPDAVAFDVASGCVVSAATALVLVDAALLKPGARVLINSPCGGIGHFATQLVRKAIGPEGRITGICAAGNEQFAKQLGCDEVVPYDHVPDGTSLPEYLTRQYGLGSEDRRFDAVVDAYGSQPIWHRSANYLKEGADHPYATVGVKAPVKVSLTGGVPRRHSAISMFVDDNTMDRLKRELETDSYEAHIGGVWKFEDAKQAYVQLLDGHARGKLVVEIRGSDI